MEDTQAKAKKPIFKRWWFWVIVVIIVIVAASSSGNKDQTTQQTGSQPATTQQQPSQPAEQAIEVTAVKLAGDYRANEVNGDNLYKGKLVKVTGTIGTIGKDITNNMYVAIEGDTNSITSVQCYFKDDAAGQLAQLAKGQKITIQGRVNGLMGNVLVKECSIVQ